MRAIKATVDARAITISDRFFNASIQDIINELLQNSRRAGATRVDINYSSINNEDLRVTIKDDGCGIKDPSILLRLFGSDWDKETQGRESPAGVGTFSIAKRGGTYRSSNWQINIIPEHYFGELECPVIELDETIVGTEVSFTVKHSNTSEERFFTGTPGTIVELHHFIVPAYLKTAVTYYPIPVFINGVPTIQKNITDDCVWHYHSDGLHIGTYKASGYSDSHSCFLNFHGIVNKLPSIHNIGYSFAVDVIDCPELQLVLPARKELVETAFTKRLTELLYITLFNTIKEVQGGVHNLSWKTWMLAKKLGITLPEAEPTCYTAPNLRKEDDEDSSYSTHSVESTAEHWIYDLDFDEDLSLAIDPSHFAMVREEYERRNLPLLKGKSGFEEYSWYPKNRLTNLDIYYQVFDEDGKVTKFNTQAANDELDNPEGMLSMYSDNPLFEKGIYSKLQIVVCDEAYDLDYIVIPTDEYDIDGFTLLRSPKVDVTYISRIMDTVMDMSFRYDNEGDADSYDTQRDYATNAIEDKLNTILSSKEESLKIAINRLLRKESYLFFEECDLHISVVKTSSYYREFEIKYKSREVNQEANAEVPNNPD